MTFSADFALLSVHHNINKHGGMIRSSRNCPLINCGANHQIRARMDEYLS